jgi:glutathione S-transferase
MVVVARQVAGAIWRGVVDPDTDASRKLMVLGGFFASGLRVARATVIGKLGPRPEKPMVLWDFERCSASRSVREALSTLDLDADVRPCPVGGTRFRPELEGKGVPRLHDPNTGDTLSGSQAIVRHLYAKYGARPAPRLMISNPVRILTGLPIRVLTGDRGSRAQPSRAPEKPLELYSFEASPYCRFARARLSELELPYLLHNVAKGSPRRREFIARSGKMQVPWLFDPNTGTSLFESQAIERYLQTTYGA